MYTSLARSRHYEMILIYRKLKLNLLKNLLFVIRPPVLTPRRIEIEKMGVGTHERLHVRMNQVTLLIPVGKHSREARGRQSPRGPR